MNNLINSTEKKLTKKKLNKTKIIANIENKYLREPLNFKEGSNEINSGDLLRIGYKIPEGDKERIQYYEGIVIAQQNRTLSKTFTIRRKVQGIGVEQIFLLNSPKIASITRKKDAKVRRSKLYFIRSLSGKSTRLKLS